mmetsp:Transcript_34650/g.55396  ORF Transcript_34650/g.55396 Transcript_34650/m.55396 type:complete len:228 (+) Transcript_34650:2302-2985(+)
MIGTLVFFINFISSCIPPRSSLDIPSTSSMITRRFSLDWDKLLQFNASPRTREIIFFDRASLALSSITSYPAALLTIPAAEDFPIPGGPESRATLEPGFSLLKGGGGPPLMCILSHFASQFLSALIFELFPIRSPTTLGLYLSTHNIILGFSSLLLPVSPSFGIACACAFSWPISNIGFSGLADFRFLSHSSSNLRNASSSKMFIPFSTASLYLRVCSTGLSSSRVA